MLLMAVLISLHEFKHMDHQQEILISSLAFKNRATLAECEYLHTSHRSHLMKSLSESEGEVSLTTMWRLQRSLWRTMQDVLYCIFLF